MILTKDVNNFKKFYLFNSQGLFTARLSRLRPGFMWLVKLQQLIIYYVNCDGIVIEFYEEVRMDPIRYLDLLDTRDFKKISTKKAAIQDHASNPIELGPDDLRLTVNSLGGLGSHHYERRINAAGEKTSIVRFISGNRVEQVSRTRHINGVIETHHTALEGGLVHPIYSVVDTSSGGCRIERLYHDGVTGVPSSSSDAGVAIKIETFPDGTKWGYRFDRPGKMIKSAAIPPSTKDTLNTLREFRDNRTTFGVAKRLFYEWVATPLAKAANTLIEWATNAQGSLEISSPSEFLVELEEGVETVQEMEATMHTTRLRPRQKPEVMRL